MTHPLVVNIRTERCQHYVGKPSVFENPFSENASSEEFKAASKSEAIVKYAGWLQTQPELLDRIRTELRGKVLGCWCAPSPCHAEIIAVIANQD